MGPLRTTQGSIELQSNYLTVPHILTIFSYNIQTMFKFTQFLRSFLIFSNPDSKPGPPTVLSCSDLGLLWSRTFLQLPLLSSLPSLMLTPSKPPKKFLNSIIPNLWAVFELSWTNSSPDLQFLPPPSLHWPFSGAAEQTILGHVPGRLSSVGVTDSSNLAYCFLVFWNVYLVASQEKMHGSN